MRCTLIIFLLISTLAATPPAPASAAQKTAVLFSHNYFQTTNQAIKEAKKSIYVAMYLINVEPAPTDNPASILLESLINAHKRGVSVNIILDDTNFSINYNAYKRLKDSGVHIYLDSPKAVLHGKAIVIDSRICILGSFNWSRASLSDNYEFATYIRDPGVAKILLNYFNSIQLRPEIPLLPQEYMGLKLPLELLTASPKSPLSELLTSRSEKAFDLYLYLLKKAQDAKTDTLKIDHAELGKAIGYTQNYYFYLYQPLHKLKTRYHLIRHKLWSKTLALILIASKEYLIIPDAYWDYGLDKKLSFPAKYMFLVSLAEAQKSQRSPYWFRSNEDLSKIYHISSRSVTRGITELEAENIIEVFRHKPEQPGEFEERQANDYCLNPLQSEEEFQQALQSLSVKYGADITRQAQQLSSQLNEPKDLEKIETYIELIKEYGYERVEEVNSEVATKRRESGFHDISQVILLLKPKGLSPEGTAPEDID